MRQGTTSMSRRMIDYVKDAWDELDYAQRRLLEINTATDEQRERWQAQARVEQLEAVYALEHRGAND